MAAGRRSQNRRISNPPPSSTAAGNRGGRGGVGGRVSARDQTPSGPSALEVAQPLERERLPEEARLQVVRQQQEEGARILAELQREEEEKAHAQQQRRAMRGRTDPNPPPITARGRNAMEAAGLSGSGQTHAARQA